MTSADQYLLQILAREAVDTGPYSPVRGVGTQLMPGIQSWAGMYLSGVQPSGSFAKGTANASGTDIDLFISVDQSVPNTMKEIYETLFSAMSGLGFQPRKQNVSINVKVGGYSVDLVPGKRQDTVSQDHSLYRRRADTWTKTNVQTHISTVVASGRQPEIRLIKLWRDQKGLDFPSFYLELTVLKALAGGGGTLADRVMQALNYLSGTFSSARVMDPANTNNVVSDDLNATERGKIAAAAGQALRATNWSQIVQ